MFYSPIHVVPSLADSSYPSLQGHSKSRPTFMQVVSAGHSAKSQAIYIYIYISERKQQFKIGRCDTFFIVFNSIFCLTLTMSTAKRHVSFFIGIK